MSNIYFYASRQNIYFKNIFFHVKLTSFSTDLTLKIWKSWILFYNYVNMSEKELQEEEREVLSSIYDGDQCFKETSSNTYQYKYGESDTVKSFLLEIKWGDKYPNELPTISMDAFYNKHIMPVLKNKIVGMITTEAEQYLGMSMTYSLFEFLKEKFDELIEQQPEEPEKLEFDTMCITESDLQLESNKKEKKEQLTKAQKRRQWNRTDGKGEKPRGWNWVDIVKHLSQTGSKDDNQPIPN